jgi:hypothetical protein
MQNSMALQTGVLFMICYKSFTKSDIQTRAAMLKCLPNQEGIGRYWCSAHTKEQPCTIVLGKRSYDVDAHRSLFRKEESLCGHSKGRLGSLTAKIVPARNPKTA